MNKSNLKQQINEKLVQLEGLLDNLDEARIIESDEPETWDNDTLYNLIENCKLIQQLLADKTDPKVKDPYGEALVLEMGICSLIEEYNSEEKENDDY